LSHYPQQAANREYAVIASKLLIEEVGESSGSGQRYRCETEFTLQPSNEPFRLLRTIGKPKIGGLEYAVVTCPEGQEIWTRSMSQPTRRRDVDTDWTAKLGSIAAKDNISVERWNEVEQISADAEAAANAAAKGARRLLPN